MVSVCPNTCPCRIVVVAHAAHEYRSVRVSGSSTDRRDVSIIHERPAGSFRAGAHPDRIRSSEYCTMAGSCFFHLLHTLQVS